ncbi:MAG TPA: low molecular weight phosphatase family protein [Thermoplasmata archaeon]|nr:low molecular weight phosphatase family protein [Thermoplasmata archaeon]
MAPSERTVLFVCVENAGRSLMAEAMFNANPPPGWVATSAGTRPAAAPNPRTARLLAEIGLALPAHPPRLLTRQMMEAAQERVTMGCLDDTSCPAHLQGLALRDWALRDPAALDDAGFRRVRDQIAGLVRRLRTELVRADRALTERRKGRTP